MAITYQVVKITGSGVTSITSSGITTSGSPAITISSTSDSGVTINKPTDNKSNDFGTAKSNQTQGGTRLAVWEKDSAATGASHSFTITYSGSTYPVAFAVVANGVDAAAYDSGSLNAGVSGAGNPFSRPTLGQTQALNGILTFIGTDAGTISSFTNSNAGFNVTQEIDTGQFWCGAVATQNVNSTAAVASGWSVNPGASNGITVSFALKEATGGGGVSGTVAWTEASDTAALTGSATVSGAPSWTEANDTASITGSVRVSGTASWTEANDSASIAGSVRVSGSPSWTEANDTASIAGALTVSGSASWTEASDTAALTGTVGTVTTGTISWTESDDTASLTGVVSVSGSVSWIEANDSASITGSLTASGSASWTESTDSWVIQGFAGSPSGSIAWTEDPDTWALTGTSSADVVELLGGGPGLPRKKRKGGTESYLERLLGRPLDEDEPEPEEIEVIEQAAEVAAKAPKPPERDEAAEQLREYGIAFKDAYVQAFLELERKKRQQREEEDFMAVLAMAL